MKYGGLLFALISTLVIWLVSFIILAITHIPQENDSEAQKQVKLATLQMLLSAISMSAIAVACIFFILLGPAAQLLAYLREHWLFSLFAALCLIVAGYFLTTNIITYYVALAFILTFIQIAINNDLLTISVALIAISTTLYLEIKKRKREKINKIKPWNPNIIHKKNRKYQKG